jgi:4-hydroxyphenylpyruvate dioxygenase
MRRSIATVSLSGALEEKLRAAAAAGFDGVEIFESDLIACPLPPEEIRSLAETLGLTIDLYQPFRDFEAVPADVFERNLRRAQRKFELVERLGAPTMLVCSNCSPAALDDDSVATEQLARLASAAAERGIRIAYEALSWGRHVHDYLDSWRIVAAADHQHLGLCLDSFHVLSQRIDPIGIRAIPGEKIFFLQLADAPRLLMDVLQWSRHHRCFPGQGGFDLATFLTHVLAAGYRGPLSLEVFNDVFRQTDAERTAIDAMRSLLALEDALPAELGRSLDGDSLPGERVGLGRLPPPAELRGDAFVELAVDGTSEASLAGLLGSLGFALAGRHRTKPVRLWQQAAIRVLLNAGDRRLSDRLHGTAVVTALAIESADPARSASRARALLARVRPRELGPDEAELTEFAAPDGTSVFFCRTDVHEAGSWLQDFAPLNPDLDGRGVGLTGVDHVALVPPFGLLEEAALFWHSVLGLRPGEVVEIAGPHGLVRSQALTSPSGDVRIVLNVPLLGDGPPYRWEVQHVAFACDDIFQTAAAVRALRAPTLSIGRNYYDDLAARFELEAGLLEVMQAHGILYERDDRGGEFFHFSTPTAGGRLFFEVVQRVGGYTGFGASNAAVRMASQIRWAARPGLR